MDFIDPGTAEPPGGAGGADIQPADRTELRRLSRRRRLSGTHALWTPVQADRLYHRRAHDTAVRDGSRQLYEDKGHEQRGPYERLPEGRNPDIPDGQPLPGGEDHGQ